MNIECRAEIARIVGRTSPAPSPSPLMILAKWVYLDAARIAEAAGQPSVAHAIRQRTILDSRITNVPEAIAKLPQETA